MIGKSSLACFCVLPMNIYMMGVVPSNLEAFMYAILTATFEFSTDWGAELCGTLWLNIL